MSILNVPIRLLHKLYGTWAEGVKFTLSIIIVLDTWEMYLKWHALAKIKGC